EVARFRPQAAEGVRAQVSLALLEGWFGIVASVILGCGMAAALFVGVTHVRAGALTLGNFLLITGYLAQLYAPLKTISKKASSLQGQLASAERVFALLDTPADVPECRHPHGLTRASGAIAFENVSFAYDSQRTVLEQVSF